MGLRFAPVALLLFALSCGDNVHTSRGTVVVSPRVGLFTDETGATATFTVALTAPPMDEVVVTITSQNVEEGSVFPRVLVFDADNFADAQTVTITGADDDVTDGPQEYAVRIGTDRLGSYEVQVTNGDDDVVGVHVAPVAALMTSEAGQQATFTVRLSSQPAADVRIPISSTDPSEGTINTAELVFTAVNWSQPQTVTITGENDSITDGAIAYQIALDAATSIDADYDGFDADDVQVVNTDNDDVVGITVTPVSGLSVSETGTQATFTVVLQTAPTGNVTIPVSSSDTTEATVSTAPLMFTSGNWNTPQTVTVTGVNDTLDDGDMAWTIVLAAATSSDSTYNGVNPADVMGTTTDNDGAGVTVSPTSGLVVSETGTQATFTVVLQAQPTANVTIPVMSIDTTEATVSTASLVFTTANWNTPQQVTVTGVDDFLDDGNQPFTIVLGAATSSDGSYSGLNPTDVTGSTTDNDSTNVTVTPTSGLVTTESGGTATFTVRLTSQPTATVTIPVSSSDPGEGTPAPASLMFTTANWLTPQTVTVTGIDDALTDGAQAYTIVLGPATSSDVTYTGFNATDVAATNADNEVTAGFTFDTTSLVVSEFRDADIAQLQLASPPTANVVITLTSSDTTEGTVAPATLTFTPQNWNMPQQVIVTGADDNIADGTITFSIITSAATSADSTYNGMAVPDITVMNLDNDGATVDVRAGNNLRVSESGTTTTFRVALTVQPTATVTCTVMSSDLTEGTLSPTTLTFTPANYLVLQTVTVTGVDDPITDGDVVFLALLAPCTSADPAYQGSNPRDVAILNRDND